MTTHSETPPPPRTWGAPIPTAERPNRPWSTRRIVLSAAMAVVIVAGGTVGVIAATNHSTTTAGNGGPGGGGGPGGFGGGRFGGGPGGGPGGFGLANALHGDFVVSSNGSYVTDRLQTGTVSAVSATDITVASADGYTQTYTVNSSTSVDRGNNSISNVVKGNTVTVIATLSGSTATATTIEDRSLDTNGGNAGPGGSGGLGGPPPGN